MNSRRLSKERDSIPAEWYSTLKTEEEKKEFEQYLRNSTRLFDLLKRMIQRRYDQAVAVKGEDYENSAWPYLQAHRNGRLEALEEVWKLLP